ncbi:MAG: hypothetical protein M0R02_13565 [Bacteroidales bacterium]|nr:hypothetical protein [Bacteroidales bacterium]
MRPLAKYIATLAFLPMSLLAQPQAGEDQLQMLMQGAMQMQACLAKLDQAKLEDMGKKAQAMEKELKGLCASGERDVAQAKAVDMAVEFANSEEMQQLKQCGAMAQAMVPQLLAQIEALEEEGPDASTHVCDNL